MKTWLGPERECSDQGLMEGREGMQEDKKMNVNPLQ